MHAGSLIKRPLYPFRDELMQYCNGLPSAFKPERPPGTNWRLSGKASNSSLSWTTLTAGAVLSASATDESCCIRLITFCLVSSISCIIPDSVNFFNVHTFRKYEWEVMALPFFCWCVEINVAIDVFQSNFRQIWLADRWFQVRRYSP